MGTSVSLELARSAVVGRRWREACERFAEARSVAEEELAPADLERFATALFLHGEPRAASGLLIEAYESYQARDDAAGAARTAGWIALELLESDDLPSSMTWAARGVRLIEGLGDLELRGAPIALVPAALGAMLVGDIDDSLRRFDEIAALAERSSDSELLAVAALGRGKCLTTIGESDDGLASLEKAKALMTADEISPIMPCILFRVMLDVAHEAFDLTRAETWTAAFEEWCRTQPELVAYVGQGYAYRSRLYLVHGRWDDASSAAIRADECLRAGDFTATYLANYQLAELHRLRGEFRAADERYRQAAATGWDPQPGWSLLRLAEGAITEAQTMLRRNAGGADEGTRRRLLPAVVEVELAAGDDGAARRAADDLSALSRRAPTPMLVAVAGFAYAQVLHAEGDAAAALEAVEAARNSWSEISAPYEVARCRVLEGRILRELDRPDAASTQLNAARAVLIELDARPAVAALNDLMGIRTTVGLTPRELEVLRLVSTGLTNRGIADRLMLSDKTVARHLANIYSKLGLSSRSGATAYAYENGLV
jgi:DNA-binding CsgD family transcriptional regulator